MTKFTNKEELRRWHEEGAERHYKAAEECRARYRQAETAEERLEATKEALTHVLQAELHESAAEVLREEAGND